MFIGSVGQGCVEPGRIQRGRSHGRRAVRWPAVWFAVSLLGLLGAACAGEEHTLGRACPELIDDMEDGKSSILSNGRVGEWFSYNDGSPEGMQVPRAAAPEFPLAKLDPPRGSSMRAVHTSGSGFTGVWGAGVGFDLQLKMPYDASAYRGIGFWARAGSGADERGRQLRVNLPDGNTAVAGGRCEEELCSDDFGHEFALQDDFQYYQFNFDELEQAGWSGRTFDALAVSEVYGVRFQSQPESKFDFWIDDVTFLCE